MDIKKVQELRGSAKTPRLDELPPTHQRVGQLMNMIPNSGDSMLGPLNKIIKRILPRVLSELPDEETLQQALILLASDLIWCADPIYFENELGTNLIERFRTRISGGGDGLRQINLDEISDRGLLGAVLHDEEDGQGPDSRLQAPLEGSASLDG